jgi:hypothetical protein
MGSLRTSPNGINWTGVGTLSIDVLGLAYGNGIYVGLAEKIYSSPYLNQWTDRGGAAVNWKDVRYLDGLFVAVRGINISTSVDGVAWTHHPILAQYGSAINSVARGNGIYLAVTDFGVILTSPDGDTWSYRTQLSTGNLLGVCYGAGIFVAVGVDGALVTSPDGKTWTSRGPSSLTSHLFGVTHGNGQFVAVGAEGVILTSPDGTKWTQQVSGTTGGLSRVAYGDGLYIAIGADGVFTSPAI